MRFVSYGTTHPGRLGDVNDDSFLADDARGLYVVSDGVGMYRGAALASRCVVEAVSEALRSPPPPSDEARRRWLLGAVKDAAAALVARARDDKALASMSATLTLLQLAGDEAMLAHVGDSRAYLFRDRSLSQLTRDHSVAFEQYEAGAFTKDAIRTHPNQRLLTRTVRASSSFVLPDVAAKTIVPGDRFLLCSDGLTKELSDERIGALLASTNDLSALGKELVRAANEAGGRDNITVVVIDAS